MVPSETTRIESFSISKTDVVFPSIVSVPLASKVTRWLDPVFFTINSQPDPTVAADGQLIVTLPPIAVSSTVRTLSLLNTVYDVVVTGVTEVAAFD